MERLLMCFLVNVLYTPYSTPTKETTDQVLAGLTKKATLSLLFSHVTYTLRGRFVSVTGDMSWLPFHDCAQLPNRVKTRERTKTKPTKDTHENPAHAPYGAISRRREKYKNFNETRGERAPITTPPPSVCSSSNLQFTSWRRFVLRTYRRTVQ